MLFGPISQLCQPWPSTPAALHHHGSHCHCTPGLPGAHRRCSVPPLLRERWPTAASSAPASSSEPASPAGTNLGTREESGTALEPAPCSTWQPAPSKGCKDAPGSSTVRSCGLPASQLTASASTTGPPCPEAALVPCPHTKHPMAKCPCTAASRPDL